MAVAPNPALTPAPVAANDPHTHSRVILAAQAQGAMTEERFVKIVEDDLQRIGRWVTMHSESLHTKLGKLLISCSDESYPVDYLRGERTGPRRTPRAPRGLGLRAEAPRLFLPRPAEQADELGKMTCELDKLILLNYEV